MKRESLLTGAAVALVHDRAVARGETERRQERHQAHEGVHLAQPPGDGDAGVARGDAVATEQKDFTSPAGAV